MISIVFLIRGYCVVFYCSQPEKVAMILDKITLFAFLQQSNEANVIGDTNTEIEESLAQANTLKGK